SGVRQLALGNLHACALTTTGQVLCMGNNTYGQLGNGNTDASMTPVLVGGNDALANIVAVAAGQEATCALHSNGTVYCWGRNNHLQLGVPNSGEGGVTQSSNPVTVTDVVG